MFVSALWLLLIAAVVPPPAAATQSVPNPRIAVYPTVLVSARQLVNGKLSGLSVAFTLTDTTTITLGAFGVIVRTDAHDMTVYPAGSTLTIGSGEGVGYMRPGTPLHTVPANGSGCTITFRGADGIGKTQHYAQDCGILEVTKPWRNAKVKIHCSAASAPRLGTQ